MAIQFLNPRDPHGCFSSFSRHRVNVWGRIWSSSEHGYQAAKFLHNRFILDRIQEAGSPREAADIGRNPANLINPDWDKLTRNVPSSIEPDDKLARVPEKLFYRTKDVAMYAVCLAKFRQNPKIRSILLDTGGEPLIEASAKDGYWGWGALKKGQNKLGRILMVVRETVRNEPTLQILEF